MPRAGGGDAQPVAGKTSDYAAAPSVLTIVIPHRTDPARLGRLLETLGDWPLIVADDSDDGVQLGVPTVRLGGGFGFAKCVNAGLAMVKTPLALVLNDDAQPEADCLEKLAVAADEGVPVGPVLRGPNGIESAGIAVSGWGRVRQITELPADESLLSVAAVSGACMRISANARFDERFPHGFEDVELCRRLGGARLHPSATCRHEGGGTLDRRSPEASAKAVTGQLLLFPPGWREPVIVALHVAQVLREGGRVGRFGAIATGWAAARARRG